ncbi:hypothetical protein [Massilia pseudoviolaceinigra]|uniref:hypothetical protein n=1 Tax=Massilia pseudoviolaceinigra TaxID=3057165 RepID=UPI002796E1AA|nr:hypothetical protein [Massilia sp. CCM 9206]MDQ1920351.1 hypothetical protein [Massilia sp. CCM 9206]
MIIDTFLTTDPSTVKTRPNGSATGVLFLNIGGVAFPTEGWDDFVVTILGWWAQALLRLSVNDRCTVTVPFMEGDYAVKVLKTSAATFEFRAVNGISSGFETATGEAAARPFIDSFILQSHRILGECKQQGWWSANEDALASSLEALEYELKRFGPGTDQVASPANR